MLIVFEGIDFSGKTTQSKRLATRIGARWQCFPDRSTPIGDLIGRYLRGDWRAAPTFNGKAPDIGPFQYDQRADLTNPMVFQALQLANRTEHLLQLERAKLEVDGWDLVLDRYWGSGYAYGKRDGLDPAYLLSMHAGLPQPDLNILLDLPAEVAMERRALRPDAPEMYDRVEMLREIRSNYLELWDQHARDPRWIVLAANRQPDELAEALLDCFRLTEGLSEQEMAALLTDDRWWQVYCAVLGGRLDR